MTSIIHETGTQVIVKYNADGFEKVKDIIESDPILSQVLTPAAEQLGKDIDTLKNKSTDFAKAVGEQIRSYQEEYIVANNTVDTGLMRDTILVETTGEAEALVGATALSEAGFPYPVVIDSGSKFYAGKPFVAPSLESIDKDLDDIFDTEIMTNIGGWYFYVKIWHYTNYWYYYF